MIDFNNINVYDGRKENSFEEFVCQLASIETIPNSKRFFRLGNPDGGIECYWELNNGDKIGWQAKYFLNDINWGNIKTSLETSLEKHEKIVKFIIALPKELTLDQSETYKNKVEEWEEKYAPLKIGLWTAETMMKKIIENELNGMMGFWFDDLELSDSWFESKSHDALLNLKNIIIPNLEIKSENETYFDIISRNSKSKNHFIKKTNEYITNFKHDLNSIRLYKKEFNQCEDLLDALTKLENVLTLELDQIIKNLTSFEKYYFKLDPFNKNMIVNNLTKICDENDLFKEFIYNSDYNRQLSVKLIMLYRHINNNINSFKKYLNSIEINLLTNPILMCYGEAGIGKSFLFWEIVNKKISNDENTLLILGQQFHKSYNIENNLLNEFGIPSKYTFDDFLDALEYKAKLNKKRITIFIDAINEGMGIFEWKKYISSFIDKIGERKYLGLCFSIRTTFKDSLDLNQDTDNKISELELKGFENNPTAILKFFEHYHISVQDIDLFNVEFYNPLFLNIYCKTRANNRSDYLIRDTDGLANLFEEYLDSANYRILETLELRTETNLVKKSLKSLIENNITNDLMYDDAQSIVSESITTFNIQQDFLQLLIDENVLKRVLKNNNEYITISFQILNDYLYTEHLLKDISSITELKIKVNEYLKDFNPIYGFNLDLNIIEMFSIYIPEKYNIELFELLDETLNNNSIIMKATLNSLKWRNKTINNSTFEYINNHILTNQKILSDYWKIIIQVSCNKTHPLNALKTHEFLYKLDLKTRDYLWTINLNELYDRDQEETNERDNFLKMFINFAFLDDLTMFNDENIKLFSIILTWFLTSTCGELRDITTKALINLLKNNLNILIDILNMFETVNDPYIYERLYATAYGCALSTNNNLDDLTIYVYETIFNKELVYPNVLVRDYARNIIEIGYSYNTKLKIDLNKITPPYNSTFPEIPPDYEINKSKYGHFNLHDKYLQMKQNYAKNNASLFFENFGSIILYLNLDQIRSEFNDENIGSLMIYHSMQLEYSRDNKSLTYGYFGRYIFQHNFEPFKQILNKNNIELMDLKNIAIKRIFELGYDNKLYNTYDKTINQTSKRMLFERIGKKYQWIAFHELFSQVTDKYPSSKYYKEDIQYNGPWQFYIRDIDPSITYRLPKYEFVDFNKLYDANNFNDVNWLNDTDLPNIDKILEINFLEKNWMLLDGFIEWKENETIGKENYPKNISISINSFLVNNEDLNNITKYLKNRNLLDLRLPTHPELCEIFNREIPSSLAFEDIAESEIDTYEFKLDNKWLMQPPTLMYNPIENDKSYKNYYLKISKDIFNKLNLKYGDYNTVYYSENNDIICFDSIELSDNYNKLFFDKEALIDYLNKTNLNIIFTINIEKQNYDKFQKFQGTYYLKDNELTGNIEPYTKISFKNLTTIIYSSISEESKTDLCESYFDKNNSIHYVFNNENSETIKNQFLCEYMNTKRYNNHDWDITFIHKNPQNENNCFNMKYSKGYLISTKIDETYYSILISSDTLNSGSNHNFKLYKKFVLPILVNSDIIENRDYLPEFDEEKIKIILKNLDEIEY